MARLDFLEVAASTHESLFVDTCERRRTLARSASLLICRSLITASWVSALTVLADFARTLRFWMNNPMKVTECYNGRRDCPGSTNQVFI